MGILKEGRRDTDGDFLLRQMDQVVGRGDENAGKMYWTDEGTNKIQRANLDGSGVEDLVTAIPRGIALDLGAGKRKNHAQRQA